MAHVLFGNATPVQPFDPDTTTPFDADITALFGLEEQITLETPVFDEPLPIPAVVEPAYLVEVQSARRSPRILAVRESLEDAKHVAESVHPAAGDVSIHEVQLPCDAATFVANLSRTWTRMPGGEWILRPVV